jgi:osmoprotectant transport system permease protein
MEFWDYISIFQGFIVHLLIQHLWLFAVSMVGALVLGVVFGVLVHRVRALAFLVPVVNVLQATPEIVLLAISIPLLGIGYVGALVPLFVKGVLPVMRNTMSGLASVDPGVSEAARGIGMSNRQVLFRIELVAALPVIIAGMRVSAIMLVSVITLTAYIGVESLGTLILQGISRMDPNALLVGCGLAAALAVAVNQTMLIAERFAARRVGVRP